MYAVTCMSVVSVIIYTVEVRVWIILTTQICTCSVVYFFFFFQAEDGIRDLVRSRGLGDVYKRQAIALTTTNLNGEYLFTGLADGNYSTGFTNLPAGFDFTTASITNTANGSCLLYTSDAADERSSVDLGGRRIIKKKKNKYKKKEK